jgi:G3E family GTPase
VADIVIINKIDKVEAYQKDTVRNIIKRMNSQAQIAESSFGEVVGFDVLNLKSFSQESLLQTKFDDKPKKLTERHFSPAPSVEKPMALFAPGMKSNVHSDIACFSFVFPEALDLLRFDIWMRTILNHKSLRLYRVKGILSFRNIDEKLIFQAVNNQYLTDSAGMWGQEERSNKIVFIGKNLSREFLLNGLHECCTEEPFEPEQFYKFLSSQNLQ